MGVLFYRLLPGWNITSISTYFGGRTSVVGGYTDPSAIAIDGQGNPYIAGNTDKTDLPLVNPVQKRMEGQYDGFIAKFSSDGQQLLFSTYLGEET